MIFTKPWPQGAGLGVHLLRKASLKTHLSRKPVVLFHASLERMSACRQMFHASDYVLTSYLGGVAVECILQAIAFKLDAPRDARHDLAQWLTKCPEALQNEIRTVAPVEWSRMASLWDNGLRYLSYEGFLGYLRDKNATRGISGGPNTVVRENARRLMRSADIIHQKGVAQWLRFTEKS